MKKLLLLRHGNAASRVGNMTDYDRPLDSTGKKQITIISNKLTERNQLPDLIFSSSAVRAISSAGFIQNKKPVISIIETDLLYSADIFEYMDIISAQQNSYETIMIVAHNPTISGFISKLAGKHIGMGTGNLCILQIDIKKWSDLSFISPVISSTVLKP